jgi:hypothetical protein
LPAATSVAQPSRATQKDAVQLKCDELADAPEDPERGGTGVSFDNISVAEAISV